MLGCFGCTTLSCYKDADELVYYNGKGAGNLYKSNGDINQSDGNDMQEAYRQQI